MSKYEEVSPPFGTYVSHVFVTLSHLKIASNHNSALYMRIVDTCVTSCLLSLNFLLVLSEAIDVKEAYDLPSFAARINPLVFHLIGFIKWVYCIVRYDDIQEMIDDMEECHRLCQQIGSFVGAEKQYKTMMTACQRSSITFVKLWMTICVSGVVQWCSNPIMYDYLDVSHIQNNSSVMYTRHLPYPGWFPWKMESLKLYIIYFTFQFVGAVGSGIGIGAFDILALTYVKFICVQMEYLVELSTKDVSTSVKHSNRREPPYIDFTTKLKNCLALHQQTLKVFGRIDNILSLLLFAQCWGNIIALCLVSLEASTMKIDSSAGCIMRLISMFEYWTGIEVEMFMYCYVATTVHEVGLKVSDAFYNSQWENFLHQNQLKVNGNELIPLAILRAQKPMEICGGPFFILNLQTFRALTSMSLSNAIVLRQLSDRE